jgi:hypothetical protein
MLPEEVRSKAEYTASSLKWSPSLAISFICWMLKEMGETELLNIVALRWKSQTGRGPDGFDIVHHPGASKSTPGPWAVMGANVFRVVAPGAPHENEMSGICPPFPYAIVCETNPDSVPGDQAAANAQAISQLPTMQALLLEYVRARGNPSADLVSRTGVLFHELGL